MKSLILIVTLFLPACGAEKNPWKEGALVEGGPCNTEHMGYGSAGMEDFKTYTHYKIPKGQWAWDCIHDKFHHDIAQEQARASMIALVKEVRPLVTTRKLTPHEMTVVSEATDHGRWALDSDWGSEYYPAANFSFAPEPKNIGCILASQRTADLVAQLSFWHPTEAELPLKTLESYVKGMTCDAGTERAYSIMNERIIKWLKEKK